MKTKTKVVSLVAAVLVVALGATVYLSGQSNNLQGSFGGKSVGMGTWALDAASPSGAHSVSDSDEVMVFSVTAPATKDLKFADGTHFDFAFSSSSYDIDWSAAKGTEVTLRNEDGRVMGNGYIVSNSQGENPSGAWASVYFTNATWSPVSVAVAAGSTMRYNLTVDTESLMDEDSGVDDILDVSMTYRTVSGSQSVSGNTLNY